VHAVRSDEALRLHAVGAAACDAQTQKRGLTVLFTGSNPVHNKDCGTKQQETTSYRKHKHCNYTALFPSPNAHATTCLKQQLSHQPDNHAPPSARFGNTECITENCSSSPPPARVILACAVLHSSRKFSSPESICCCCVCCR
jgi:hypothetical protein